MSSMKNCRNCDTVQRATCSEVRGEIEAGLLVTKYVEVPTPVASTLTVRVLDRFEFDAIAEKDCNTLYLIRG